MTIALGKFTKDENDLFDIMAGGGGMIVVAISVGDGVGLSGRGGGGGNDRVSGGVHGRGSNGAGLGGMGAEHED